MSSKAQKNKIPQNKSKKKIILILVLVALVLLLIISLSLPLVIKKGIQSWFESQNVNLVMGDIDIAITDGSISLKNIKTENKIGRNLNIDEIKVSWKWRPLFDKQFVLEKLEIKSVKVEMALFADGGQDISGIIIKAADGKENIKKNETEESTKWSVIVKDVVLSDIELCIQTYRSTEDIEYDYCGKIRKINWMGNASYSSSRKSDMAEGPLSIKGSLNIYDIEVHNNKLGRDLVRIQSYEVKTIDITAPDNINIGNINVKNVFVLEREGATNDLDRYVFFLKGLEIKTVEYKEQKILNIGKIEAEDSGLHLVVNKDGRMEFDQWLSKNRVGETDKKKKNTKASPSSFIYKIDEFIFDTNQHHTFIDNSLKEPFSFNIHAIEFNLNKLDSKFPEEFSHAKLALAIGKHGSLKIEADINPLSNVPSLKGAGEVVGFDLRMLAPFTKQHMGHNIKSGQLDVDLKINVDKGIIDSSMGLALHQFQLKTLNNKEAEALNSEFGFPLNSSLSLLRDRDNTIRLVIPVSGDIENPEFNPKDAIVKASSKAITAAILHYYTPFGLVFAAESLFNLATALNFDPVLFFAGDTEISSSHEKQLNKLLKLMSERPGIHLTLCGMSNKLDKNKLFPDLVKKGRPERDKENKNEVVSNENLLILKKLAESRSANIKHYMVEKNKIKSSRLIECDPEYQENSISGVEISL